jgi:hypothetical protein
LHVALRIAREYDRAQIVLLLADGGWKYMSARLWTADMPRLQEEMERSVWW